MGISTVAYEDGCPSLIRLGIIVEQISESSRNRIKVIFVSHRRLSKKQGQLGMSFIDLDNAD